MRKQRKPGWAFWMAIVVLAPVLYIARFGPACWLIAKPYADPGGEPSRLMGVYTPLVNVVANGSSRMADPLYWWMALGIRQGYVADLPLTIDGSRSLSVAVPVFDAKAPLIVE